MVYKYYGYEACANNEAHIQPLLRMHAAQGHSAFKMYYNSSYTEEYLL